MAAAQDFINHLASQGRYHLTSEEFRSALGLSRVAAKLSLNRLGKRGVIANPARGFWVIVPPEYRRLGCLPPEQFVPSLMEYAGVPYYAGLLTAAQYHGAAHHRPQEFQVMVGRARRPLECGAARVAFHVRKGVREVPMQDFITLCGPIHVSTPEATAIDLLGYHRHSGGLNHVATVLMELSPVLHPVRLVAAARTAPMPWAQRLGWLLELVGASGKLEPLRKHVREHARDATMLVPGYSLDRSEYSSDWRLHVNLTVEPEA